MLEYIEKKNKALCCGCRSCEQICPVKAISFVNDEEGFLYPHVGSNCINCGLCEKTCPVSNDCLKNEIRSVYSVQNNDEKVLNESSSGGVFRLLADYIISQGGYVVGCVWDDNHHPVLCVSNSTSELVKMQGSKYLYSDSQNLYVKVRELLEKNQMVLFTGTPCQCAGLKNFLHKDYDKLFVTDFLCHGVPSQKAFDSYFDYLISHYHIRSDKRKIAYKFRDKGKMGWGIVSSISWVEKNRLKKKYFVGLVDSYDYAFTRGFLNRYSCYDCRFKGLKRCSDMTFCDYWGYDNFYKVINYRKGVSALTINSPKAFELLNHVKIDAKVFESVIDYVAVENPAIISKKADEVPTLRKDIYSLIDSEGWEKVSKSYFRCPNWYLRKLWYMLPNSLIDAIRNMLKE